MPTCPTCPTVTPCTCPTASPCKNCAAAPPPTDTLTSTYYTNAYSVSFCSFRYYSLFKYLTACSNPIPAVSASPSGTVQVSGKNPSFLCVYGILALAPFNRISFKCPSNKNQVCHCPSRHLFIRFYCNSEKQLTLYIFSFENKIANKYRSHAYWGCRYRWQYHRCNRGSCVFSSDYRWYRSRSMQLGDNYSIIKHYVHRHQL